MDRPSGRTSGMRRGVERRGELGGTGAVIRVRALVDPPRVVEDGEESDHLDVRTRLPGQAEPILQHPGPVSDTVIAVPGEGVLFQDGVEDEGYVHRYSAPIRTVRLRPEAA